MDQMSLFDMGPVGSTGWPDRPRYLLSFAYLNEDETDLCRRHNIDLIMDSGAFTTAATGKQMDHDGYLDWLAGNADLVTFALSYDVIGDHHASAVNHDHALDRIGDVVKMVPTFHLGSPMTELDRLCRAHDFVCIGGAVPFASQPHHLFTVLQQIHRTATERGTKLHGLGMTGNKVIHRFPWYSVDSSKWLSGVKFGYVSLTDETGKIIDVEHGWKLTRHAQHLCRVHGLDPDVMQTKGWSQSSVVGSDLNRARRIQLATASARAFMYVEATKNERHPDNPMRLYLSGHSAIPATLGGSPEVIHQAHQLGNQWLHHTQPKASTS